MLHPVFSTMIERPDLLAEHASAYAALLQHEASAAAAAVVKRVVAWALALCSGLVFVMFTGMAVMLGSMQHAFHWALVAVPGFALLLMLAALARATTTLPNERFTELKAQIDSDVRALREAA